MKALEWVQQNAAAIGVVLGIVTAVFNWMAKPRTPEQLAAMPPRAAAFFRFMAAVFPDPQKATEAAWQFWHATHARLPKNTKDDRG